MRYDELEQHAKDYALQQHAENLYAAWWDNTYEDFVEVAERMGFEVTMNERKTRGLNGDGRIVNEPDIAFRLAYSQGSGAAFGATFSIEDGMDAVTKIAEHCNDEELASIAADIVAACTAAYGVARTLTFGNQLRVGVGRDRGFYMSVTTGGAEFLDLPDGEDEAEVISTCDAFDEAVLSAARSLADWLYDRLEAEYEYLTSEQSLREAELDFDEAGCIIYPELDERKEA